MGEQEAEGCYARFAIRPRKRACVTRVSTFSRTVNSVHRTKRHYHSFSPLSPSVDLALVKEVDRLVCCCILRPRPCRRPRTLRPIRHIEVLCEANPPLAAYLLRRRRIRLLRNRLGRCLIDSRLMIVWLPTPSRDNVMGYRNIMKPLVGGGYIKANAARAKAAHSCSG